jgi:hypothetical protein
MSAEAKVREFVGRLITEGEAVLASKWEPAGDWISGRPSYVELEIFQQWRSRCRLLLSMLGSLAKPWEPVLGRSAKNDLSVATSTQGALKGIRRSLQEGLLIHFEDLVLAEAFSDLYHVLVLSQGTLTPFATRPCWAHTIASTRTAKPRAASQPVMRPVRRLRVDRSHDFEG